MCGQAEADGENPYEIHIQILQNGQGEALAIWKRTVYEFYMDFRRRLRPVRTFYMHFTWIFRQTSLFGPGPPRTPIEGYLLAGTLTAPVYVLRTE